MSFNAAALISDRSNIKLSWKNDFDKSLDAFSEKIAEEIEKDVLKLAAIIGDPYRELPTQKKPLQCTYSFEIIKPNVASKLKELSKEAGDLPPFKDWFEKLCIPKQKVGRDDSFESSPFKFVKKEKEKGIDQAYFRDKMADVGKLVETRLKDIFNKTILTPENLILKVEITWHQKSLSILSSSPSKDDQIEVTTWVEEQETLPQALQATSSPFAFLDQQRASVNIRFGKDALELVTKLFLIFIVGSFLSKRD
jgi:hypothetical protein